MQKRFVRFLLPSIALVLALVGMYSASFVFARSDNVTTSTSSVGTTYVNACAAVPVGFARCLALITNRSVNPDAGSPGGSPPYAPANFHNAYNLPTSASGTPTVAIVDAYSDPNLASDLATYRSHWGLPACTTGSGCLKIVNQTGGTKLPPANAGWALEESLDVDMVSAICENCHILVVEATSNSLTNLGIAAKEAVTLGAIAVSNSYGTNEFSGESSYCSSYYSHTNVAITASSGDSGPAVQFPAVCPKVVGVGGTTLNSNGSETAWSGAGGGCSTLISKPSWQVSSVTSCSMRAVADVSADANPNTGAYVYDSYGEPGWLEVGGTSESSPIIASVFALAGNVSVTTNPASLPWKHYTSGCLYKVGGVRYAFQTGLGSPKGTACF